MITTASAKPTWASAGVSTRSPAANTPGSPVCMYSSTSTKPRLSTLDLGAVQAQVVRQRPPADRHHHRLHGDVFAVAEVDGGRAAVAARRVAGHRDTGADLDAPLLERPQHHVRHVLVAAGQDLGQGLQDGHLGAQIGEHGGELAADGPAADDHRGGRQLLEVQHLVGGQDQVAVDLEAGNAARHRAGSQDDVLSDQLGFVVDPSPGDRDRACRCR